MNEWLAGWLGGWVGMHAETKWTRIACVVLVAVELAHAPPSDSLLAARETLCEGHRCALTRCP